MRSIDGCGGCLLLMAMAVIGYWMLALVTQVFCWAFGLQYDWKYPLGLLVVGLLFRAVTVRLTIKL